MRHECCGKLSSEKCDLFSTLFRPASIWTGSLTHHIASDWQLVNGHDNTAYACSLIRNTGGAKDRTSGHWVAKFLMDMGDNEAYATLSFRFANSGWMTLTTLFLWRVRAVSSGSANAILLWNRCSMCKANHYRILLLTTKGIIEQLHLNMAHFLNWTTEKLI